MDLVLSRPENSRDPSMGHLFPEPAAGRSGVVFFSNGRDGSSRGWLRATHALRKSRLYYFTVLTTADIPPLRVIWPRGVECRRTDATDNAIAVGSSVSPPSGSQARIRVSSTQLREPQMVRTRGPIFHTPDILATVPCPMLTCSLSSWYLPGQLTGAVDGDTCVWSLHRGPTRTQ